MDIKVRKQITSPKIRYTSSQDEKRKWKKKFYPIKIDQQNKQFRIKETLRLYNRVVLVSLFNSILTFVDYLMPKTTFQKNRCDVI